MEESTMSTFTRTISSRKTALASVLVGLALLILVPGMARAQGNGGEFATGGGQAISLTPGTTFLVFALSARNGPQGPSGHVTLEWPESGEQILAEVTCLEVSGNEATITAEIVKHKNPDPAQDTTHVVIHVIDNGTPGGDVPDTFFATFQNLLPDACGVNTGTLPILQGNINVEDA
jgi:hypothetical protein